MALPHSKRAKKPAKKEKNKKSLLIFWRKIPGGKFFWILFLLISFSMGSLLLFGNKGLFHLFKLRQEREQLAADKYKSQR